jgi:hypothetical protein
MVSSEVLVRSSLHLAVEETKPGKRSAGTSGANEDKRYSLPCDRDLTVETREIYDSIVLSEASKVGTSLFERDLWVERFPDRSLESSRG